MPDWERLVRDRLGGEGDQGGEIVRELADHLEDSYTSRLLRGESTSDAVREILATAGDWASLRREIEWEEATMRDRIRTLWLPGVVLFFMVQVLLRLVQLAGYEPATWATGRAYPIQVYVPWLAVLPVAGAVAALWSRRTGQRPRQWILLSILPSVAYEAFLLFAVVAGLLIDVLMTRDTSAWSALGAFSAFSIQFAVLPGVMLALGAMLVVLFASGGRRGDALRPGPTEPPAEGERAPSPRRSP